MKMNKAAKVLKRKRSNTDVSKCNKISNTQYCNVEDDKENNDYNRSGNMNNDIQQQTKLSKKFKAKENVSENSENESVIYMNDNNETNDLLDIDEGSSKEKPVTLWNAKQSRFSLRKNAREKCINNETPTMKKQNKESKKLKFAMLKDNVKNSSKEQTSLKSTPHRCVLNANHDADISEDDQSMNSNSSIHSDENGMSTSRIGKDKRIASVKRKVPITAALTAEPSYADSLKCVLQNLKKKKMLEKRNNNLWDEFNVMESNVELSVNHTVPEQTILQKSAMSTSSQKRPSNLQEFIDQNKLIANTNAASFTLKDLSEDDEVFIMDVPYSVPLRDLKGKRMVIKKNKLRLGKHKYEMSFKKCGAISCVISTGKLRKPYKTVSITPVGSIIVKPKWDESCSTNEQENENIVSSPEKKNSFHTDSKKKVKVTDTKTEIHGSEENTDSEKLKYLKRKTESGKKRSSSEKKRLHSKLENADMFSGDIPQKGRKKIKVINNDGSK